MQIQIFYFTNLILQLLAFTACWYIISFIVEWIWKEFIEEMVSPGDGLGAYMIYMTMAFFFFWGLLIFAAGKIIWSLIMFPLYFFTTDYSVPFQEVLENTKTEDDKDKLYRHVRIAFSFSKWGGFLCSGNDTLPVRLKAIGLVDEKENLIKDYDAMFNKKTMKVWLPVYSEMWYDIGDAIDWYKNTLFGTLLVIAILVIFKITLVDDIQKEFVNGGMAAYCVMGE